MSKLKVKEKDLQKVIIEYLKLKGHFVWKNNTTGIYIKATGHYIPSQAVGSPDIIGVSKNGRFIGIEVKVGYNKASEYQKQFIEEIKARKGIGMIVYSLDEVMKVL